MKFKKFFEYSTEATALINILISKAHECNIERSTVRQLLMPLFKELVAQCTTSELGQICSQGNGFEPDPEYREAHIVTIGTNVWSAIFLSASDSGLVLLQKLAVASLLSDVCENIVAITPKNTKEYGLMPMEIISHERIEKLSLLDGELTTQIGW